MMASESDFSDLDTHVTANRELILENSKKKSTKKILKKVKKETDKIIDKSEKKTEVFYTSSVSPSATVYIPETKKKTTTYPVVIVLNHQCNK